MNIEGRVNFNGPEWEAIKRWLLSTRETKVSLLIGAANQTDSDKLRGAITMIDQLLKLENNRS